MKTRRPTISPNFNFLGQLVEFDSQLTKQRQDDSTASDSQTSEDFQTSESSSVVSQIQLDAPERAASPSKRPCMVNLSRAAEAWRSTAGGVDGVTVQSPTVALSRLQFVEPPPRQAASAAAVDVPPPKSTAAPDASPVPSSPGGKPAADTADNLLLPTAPAFQSKPTTSGVEQHDIQVTSSSSSSSAANTGSEDVSASHSKAGRSMSLSQGTQHEDQQQKLPSSSSWSHQSSSSTGGETAVKGGGKYSAAAEFGGGEATAAVGAERERPAAGVTAADMLLADWPCSLKSRSLEDILLASAAAAAPPPRSLGHAAAGQGHVTSQRDESRGHAAAANHGSLSSGHASLHGSREMIQVS